MPDRVTDCPLPDGALSRPFVMTEHYSGSKGRFKDWLTNFALCADLNGWGTEIKRKFLIFRLPGHALTVRQKQHWQTSLLQPRSNNEAVSFSKIQLDNNNWCR